MSETVPHVLGELSTYLDQQLSNSERQRVEKHLKTCANCSRHYADLQALRRMLHESPALKPPESFYQGVLYRIEEKPAAMSWFSWGIPAKALASACLVMIVVWVTHETRRTTSQVSTETKMAGLKDSSRRKVRAMDFESAEPVADQNKRKAMLLAPKNEAPVAAKGAPAGVSGAREKSDMASVPMAAPAQKKESASEEDALRQMANAPTPALKQRGDVHLQARDMNGPAAQNSFSSSLAANSGALQEVSNTRKSTASPSSSLDKMALPLEWKGTISGISVFQTVIISDANEWNTLWQQHMKSMNPQPPAPDIDFTRYMVVGVFSGQKPSGGYSVEITGTQQPADVLVVTYKETPPAPGAAPTPGPTQPFDLKAIPQNGSLIQFKKQ